MRKTGCSTIPSTRPTANRLNQRIAFSHAPQLLLFEKIVKLVQRLAPDAKICFNTTPADTAEAVRRWIEA